MERLSKRRTSQVSFSTTQRIERYSASVDERETEGCFLDFQETGLPPRHMKKPLKERRDSGQVHQSESQKAKRSREGEELRKIPKLGSFRR